MTWNVVLKSLCTWAMGVMNEVWHFSSSNKNQRKFHGVRRSVQFPLKKADKSKPLHPNFRLFSKQPTTDKKAGNGMVLFLSVLGFYMIAK